MKKLAIAGALLLLAGCAEVENYNNVEIGRAHV